MMIQKLRRLGLLGFVGFFLLQLSGCGGDDRFVVISGPGFVGIDDRPTVTITAPELSLVYSIPSVPGTFTAHIFSDQPLDGDIEFDPFSGTYFITQGPTTVFFGIDSSVNSNSEFRAFFDFPLDGSSGGDAIPLDASIVSADLIVFVDFVDFAATVPVRLDLIEYSVPSGLTAADFDSLPLSVRLFDIFDFDAGHDVQIDVTALMLVAQQLSLNDLQVRFSLGP
jgi:hypothetical protein